MDRLAAVFADHIGENLFDGLFSERRGSLKSRVISPQKPHAVDVILNGFWRQARRDQLLQKRSATGYEFLTRRPIFLPTHPRVR